MITDLLRLQKISSESKDGDCEAIPLGFGDLSDTATMEEKSMCPSWMEEKATWTHALPTSRTSRMADGRIPSLVGKNIH